MGFGNHIDASGYILYGTVRLETDIIGKACLHFLGRHALRNFYQYMCTSTDGIFHQQNHPFSLCLQLQCLFQNLCRMTFLVEIQHQALERFDGIRNGSVVVLELGTVRSPDREFRFQLFITVFYPPAHVGQPRFFSQLFPSFAGGGNGRGTVPLTDTGKIHHVSFEFVCEYYFIDWKKLLTCDASRFRMAQMS